MVIIGIKTMKIKEKKHKVNIGTNLIAFLSII